MTEEHEVQLADQQSRGRGRRAVVVGAVAVALLLLVAIASRSGDEGGDRLATENAPSDDAVLCDPLAADHPTCVREPSPTSTTIDANDVAVTTPSTTSPSTTTLQATPLQATPLHLEG